MNNFSDLVQKAFYMGVGLVSYANERAGSKIAELQQNAQKLADELVERGEMTTEEAKQFVEDIVNRAQQEQAKEEAEKQTRSEPRRIEIIDDEDQQTSSQSQEEPEEVDHLRQEVERLQEELRNLKQE
jgi:polyhydroxyalkanoate synthesis regulator phasin